MNWPRWFLRARKHREGPAPPGVSSSMIRRFCLALATAWAALDHDASSRETPSKRSMFYRRSLWASRRDPAENNRATGPRKARAALQRDDAWLGKPKEGKYFQSESFALCPTRMISTDPKTTAGRADLRKLKQDLDARSAKISHREKQRLVFTLRTTATVSLRKPAINFPPAKRRQGFAGHSALNAVSGGREP